MKKIVIAGLMQDTNLGEDVYPKCLCNLINETLNEEVEFVSLDLYGRLVRCEDNTSKNYNERLDKTRPFNRLERKLMKEVIPNIEDAEKKKHAIWLINPNNKWRLKKVYYEKIKGANLVLFAGGGIIECSLNHDYYHHIDLVTSIANRLHIPVCFNAVGRVVDPNHMYGWKFMKRALRRKCVKYITCRDGAEWLDEYCFKGKRKIATVPCAAIFTSEAFGIEREQQSDIIGIGAIRGNIFSSYEKDFSEERLLLLYKSIIMKLLEKGFRCSVFTNGYSRDYEFAKKIVMELSDEGINISLQERPNSAEMLINQIKDFRGIISARMHSCIIAYSLKIPVVAISWTQKIYDFMELIGEGESAVLMQDLNADYLVDLFEKRISQTYNEATCSELRKRVKDEVSHICRYIK